jgi:hypothetical protein
MARQGDRGAGSRRAGSFFHRGLRTTSRTCTRNVCDDGIDAADHTLQLAGAASRALEFDLFLRIPHEKFTKATALPAHELVKWQPLLLLDASRKRPMNHYSWNGRTWKAGEGRRAGQRHVPRKLCVPSGFAWAPAFRPDRPASRACRTGRPCPGRQVRNVPVPHPSGLVGIWDGPPRVARRKGRRNTDAGDFDGAVRHLLFILSISPEGWLFA